MVEMEVSRIQELEMTYGVLIAQDALTSAAHILQECGNDPNVGKMQVVERACEKLRKSLDLDDEESNLDWDEYCVDRAFIELIELRKEKYDDSRSRFLPTVEREYLEMRSKWECFAREWGPQLTQMRENSNNRVVLLRDLRRHMLAFMEYSHTNTNTSDHDETTKLHLINKLLPSLTTANTHLQHTIPTAFKQTRLVRPSHVAQVACSMTGLFLRYFESPFYQRAPLHEQLKSRSLSNKLVMLDDVIHKIACALSKRIPKTAAIFGSFLFLGSHGRGRKRLARTLAQEIYDDKDRFLRIDMSEYKQISRLIKVLDRCAYDVNSHSLLAESVRKNPHSVIVFYKLEMAHISVFSKIMSILEVGVAEDDDGNEVYFGDAVVVIVSDVGNKEMIGGLNGRHCYYTVLRNQPVNEIEGFRGMRCELLNVLDYMLLFDPISNDQLNVFAKLVMTYLEKKLRHIPLLHLFRVEGDERFKSGMPYTTSDLLNDITRAGGKDVIVR
ncbi:hypothetical protein C2S52_015133 [Perilla frutescens var. hirtella]|nr:hypothetical protein C2S52_015133 [Perilla frutescens var. hirtella]